MGQEQPTPTDRSTRIQAQLPDLITSVERRFIGAHTGVIIARPDGVPIFAQGHQQIMYMASLSKPAWVVIGLRLAERKGISLTEQIIALDRDEQQALQAEINEIPGRHEQVGDHISLAEITHLTLGLSTNVSVGLLRKWMEGQLETDISPVDYAQNEVELLFKEALNREKDQVIWTFNNSTKELGTDQVAGNGLWNCATLEEVLAIFQLIANGDSRLGVSPVGIELMRAAMREPIDPDIELATRLQGREGIIVFGKFGDYRLEDDERIPPLFEGYGLDTTRNLLCTGATERLETEEGTFDIAHFEAIPYPSVTSAPEIDELKVNVARSVTDGLISAVVE